MIEQGIAQQCLDDGNCSSIQYEEVYLSSVLGLGILSYWMFGPTQLNNLKMGRVATYTHSVHPFATANQGN